MSITSFIRRYPDKTIFLYVVGDADEAARHQRLNTHTTPELHLRRALDRARGRLQRDRESRDSRTPQVRRQLARLMKRTKERNGKIIPPTTHR